jgi:hypothetical protein
VYPVNKRLMVVKPEPMRAVLKRKVLNSEKIEDVRVFL